MVLSHPRIWDGRKESHGTIVDNGLISFCTLRARFLFFFFFNIGVGWDIPKYDCV
jgi:hypothetical protein